jgi:alpha-L-fucosidase
MVEELCSRYGPLCEIWFDGGVLTPEQGGPDVLPIVDNYQPDAVFYHSQERAHHRWAGNEAGTAGYPCWSTMPDVGSQIRAHRDQKQRMTLLRHGDPDGKVWCPPMADAPIREHDWLWVPGHEDRLQPLDRLVDMYYKSVGRNANLMLGAVPDADGLIPEADFARYAELGNELRRRFDRPLAETSGRGRSMELALPKPARIDHVVIMEDITHGERVRGYVVEGLVPGNTWQPLCGGVSIGHKRIQSFDVAEVAKLRLRTTASLAEPFIRRLAVYGTTQRHS